MVPDTGPDGPVTVTEIVLGCTASLNVALTGLITATPVPLGVGAFRVSCGPVPPLPVGEKTTSTQ